MHYENLPSNIQRFFATVKIEKFVESFFDNFLLFAQNIDYGTYWQF